MDNRQLMASIAGGDEAALQALLRRFTPLFLYILRPILPDERDREECLADISLRIWQGAGSFDGAKGSLNGWLTALTRNAALNRARAKGTEDAPLEDTVPHGDGSAEDEVLRREAEQRGIRLAMLSDYYQRPQDAPQHVLVVNYTGIDLDRLPAALERLAALWKENDHV